MPRVTFVKKAQKDNPVAKKGESYYWWKFRFGGKRYSKTSPDRSQLTQSHFLSTLWSIEDRMSGYSTPLSGSDAEGDIEGFVSELEDLRDECQESLANMPESLQYAPTGELLQERIDGLEEMTSELESVDVDVDDVEERSAFDSDEEYDDALEEHLEKMQEIEGAINDIQGNF